MRVPDFLVFGAITAATAAFSACSGTEAQPRQSPGGRQGGPPAVPVTVASVSVKPMPLEVDVVGTAEAFSSVAVRAQITGELTSVNFRQGDDVQAGQVLFTLDRRPLEAALSQAESNLRRDIAQATNAKAIAKRLDGLVARGISPRAERDTAVATAMALEATVGANTAAVENAKVQLQYATIKAPIAGRTGALMVNEGNLVRANDQTPLVVINQISPIYVSFGIPENILPELRRYMAMGALQVEATPTGDTSPPAIGRVSFVDNAVDQ